MIFRRCHSPEHFDILPKFESCALQGLIIKSLIVTICTCASVFGVAQNNSSQIEVQSSYSKDPVLRRWFSADPFQSVKAATKEETIAISLAYQLTVSEPEDKLNGEAQKLARLIFNAFNNEYPEVMNNKTLPFVLISNGSEEGSPQALRYRDVGFIVYPEEIWKSQNEASRVTILAHEMVHYLFHSDQNTSVIWLKNDKGKFFDYRTVEAKTFESLLNLFTNLDIVKEKSLGPLAVPLFTIELLDALEVYQAEKYCGLSVAREKLKVSNFLSSTVKLDSMNGRLVTALASEDVQSTTNNFAKEWSHCFDLLAKVYGKNWDLSKFPNIQRILSIFSNDENSKLSNKNPVYLVLDLLDQLNSVFDTFLDHNGIDYSKLNYYTTEDQADELSAVVLQNQKIEFNRRSLLDVSLFFEPVENLDFCSDQLDIQKLMPRSNIFIRLHRNTCARIQRLEHYTKTLTQYPGTQSFR